MTFSHKQAALAVRAWYRDHGIRVVTHDEWGSRFNYSTGYSLRRFQPRRFAVGHHHGASAQLPRLIKNMAAGLTAFEAECAQMRHVDYIHKVSNKWARGFAYTGSPGPFTGYWYEARSAWVDHGAHHNDPDRLDWPVYQMIGAQDLGLTDSQKKGWLDTLQMLSDVFGWVRVPEAQKLHREVQGWSTTQCSDPVFGRYIRLVRAGGFVPVKPSDAIIDHLGAIGLVGPPLSYWKGLAAGDPDFWRFNQAAQDERFIRSVFAAGLAQPNEEWAIDYWTHQVKPTDLVEFGKFWAAVRVAP